MCTITCKTCGTEKDELQEFVGMCKAIGRCNDYPEREYAQVGGSALPA